MNYIYFGNNKKFASSLSGLDYIKESLKLFKKKDLEDYIPSLDDILIISVEENQKEIEKARERITQNVPFLLLIKQDSGFIPLYPSAEVFLLQEPFNKSDLLSTIMKITSQKKLSTSLENVIVGSSEDTVKLRNKIVYESCLRLPLHIFGERGTGKTTVAKLVHSSRQGRKKNFVYANCTYLSDADLFGSLEEGTIGYIEEANGSTLMLDEIENLSPSIQKKLLYTVKTGHFKMVGSDEKKHSSFRLITASQKSLEQLVGENKLSLALYFAISADTIYIKPLRYHKEDIVDLVEYFKQTHNIKEGISLDYLELYKKDWKGNIRELFSYLETIYAPYILKEKDEA